jgi:hypothetical protein
MMWCWHYERKAADPRIAHQITFEPDVFGNVRDTIAIGYARRVPDPNMPEQRETKIVYAKSDFINNASATGAWLVGVAAQSGVLKSPMHRRRVRMAVSRRPTSSNSPRI